VSDTFITPNGVERRWKYPASEHPQGRCYDCGQAYSTFADLSLPHDVWAQISPHEVSEAGLLCPNCICDRLAVLNISGVVATIWPAQVKNSNEINFSQ
jgi:hypothetical protein